ncbi:hypothetical protein [Pseudomonas sp. 22 E 5]|nr:hypothetical protein [Pseudomonas sp. 22 E 5]
MESQPGRSELGLHLEWVDVHFSRIFYTTLSPLKIDRVVTIYTMIIPKVKENLTENTRTARICLDLLRSQIVFFNKFKHLTLTKLNNVNEIEKGY